MPKYCSVPKCRNGSGSSSSSERSSFYKFPLQDPVRLQSWLRNMGRENWTPSRHQYVCKEHFSPACFRLRWGVRYLEGDAVPTLFQQNQKRKAAEQTEKKPKRLRPDPGQTGSADGSVVLDGAEVQNLFHTVHLYEVSVDQSQPGSLQTGLDPQGPAGDGSLQKGLDPRGPAGDGSLQTGLDPQGPAGDGTLQTGLDPRGPAGDGTLQTGLDQRGPAGDGTLQTGLDPRGPAEGADSVLNDPLTFCQTEDDPNISELVLVSETQTQLVKRITAAILRGSGSLVLDPPEPEESLQVQTGQEVIAYFETIPNVLPSQTSAQFSPDTVLSSALSCEPISSTLPIVSKHAPTPEAGGGATEEPEEGGGATEEAEQEVQQLEEHRYHRDRLSKWQLEAVVAELQKKVKVLQQRHRRHLDKLLGLESTVSQLRQSNLLNQERLQLLERAYQQKTSADPDGTITIIYEQDAAYFYTPTNNEETTLNVDVM